MADKHSPPRGSNRPAPGTRPDPERHDAADDGPLD